MSRVYFVFVITFVLFFSSTDSSASQFRKLSFEKRNGLVRFGEQNTKGIVSAAHSSQQLQITINQDRAKADALGSSIEKHNFSLSLLKRLAFLNDYHECFIDMHKYKVKTEACKGMVIDHYLQTEFWKFYIETLALTLTKSEHDRSFCFGNNGCQVTHIDKIYRYTDNNRQQRLDEFEKRDITNSLVKKHKLAFEKIYKDKEFFKEGYYVTRVGLGEYDFDNSQFTVSLTPPTQVQSNNLLLSRLNNVSRRTRTDFSSRSYAMNFNLDPQHEFEQQIQKNNSNGIFKVNLALPMEPGKARQLAQSTRVLYAVVKLAFSEKREFVNGAELVAYMNRPQQSYHFASNMVEFYEDEALTQKIAEVPLFKVTEKVNANNKEQSPSSIYHYDPNKPFLNHQTIAFHRLKKGNLIEKDLNNIAYSVPANEKRYWIEYEQRVTRANNPSQASGSGAALEYIKQQRKQAKDSAKLSNFNWQELSTYSQQKQKDFYDIMRGHYHEQDKIHWPKSMDVVPWGMNLATIFKQGYFSTDPQDKFIEADEKTLALILKFTKEIANSQNLSRLTLAYQLKGLNYDKKNKTMVLEKESFYFHTNSLLRFDYENGRVKDKQKVDKVSQKAKNRALYKLRSSTAALDGINPSETNRDCFFDISRKSKDCVSPASGYTQLSMNNAFLSLDKQVDDISIPMTPKQAQLATGRYGRSSNLKLIIEVDNADMQSVQYEYTPSNGVDTNDEVNVLFANIHRVMVLDKDNKIIWSKKGSELSTPSEPVLYAEVEKIQQEAVAKAKQQQELERQKQKIAYEKKRQEEKARQDAARAAAQEAADANFEKQRQYDSCISRNRELTQRFDYCETWREKLSKAENLLAKSKANSCNAEESSVSCDFNNVPLTQLTVKMQECMAKECGATPKTIDEIAQYQQCAQRISVSMQQKMQAALGGNASRSDDCDKYEREVRQSRKNLQRKQCDQHSVRPTTEQCVL